MAFSPGRNVVRAAVDQKLLHRKQETLGIGIDAIAVCQVMALSVDKTNWANKLDTPPYKAFPVTCGITFTYAGLRVDTEAAVLNCDGEKIPGLYACGELVGGVFSAGYPGGSGLTSGAVFGRIAGRSAARTQRRPLGLS